MESANFDTEQLINEIKKRPEIWNLRDENYSKLKKKNSWYNILKIFIPEFENLTDKEKNEKAVQYQRKWKSIRDCYMREKRSQKSIKSGSAARHHKVYVYYENLKFLEATITDTETTNSLPVEQQPITSDEEDVDVDLQEKTEEISSKIVKRRRSSPTNNSKKRSSKDKEEEELLQILEHKYLEHDSRSEPDGDKLFLLSLYDEMKLLPPQMKIRVKSQMLDIISLAHHSLQVPPNHQWNYAAGNYQFVGNYLSHHGQHFPPPPMPKHPRPNSSNYLPSPSVSYSISPIYSPSESFLPENTNLYNSN